MRKFISRFVSQKIRLYSNEDLIIELKFKGSLAKFLIKKKRTLFNKKINEVNVLIDSNFYFEMVQIRKKFKIYKEGEPIYAMNRLYNRFPDFHDSSKNFTKNIPFYIDKLIPASLDITYKQIMRSKRISKIL